MPTNPFRRKRVAHPNNPALASYHRGDVFTPGAQNMVYDPHTANPAIMLKGPGIIVGALRITQPPPVNQSLALMTEPMAGIPVGSFTFTGLLAEEPNSDATD